MTREQRRRGLGRDALYAALAFAVALGGAWAAEAAAPEVRQPVAVYAPAPSIPGTRPAEEPEPVPTVTPEPEPTPTPGPDLSYIPLDKPLAEVLVEGCEVWGVPLDLALAVIERESGFDVDAVGPDGHDVGLFQIRESNHAWLAAETGADPETPEGNIVCGVWFLAYLYDYCGGDWEAALTCWRWGPGNEEKIGYAVAVLEAAEDWRKKV